MTIDTEWQLVEQNPLPDYPVLACNVAGRIGIIEGDRWDSRAMLGKPVAWIPLPKPPRLKTILIIEKEE